jgi:hypothetical protein
MNAKSDSKIPFQPAPLPPIDTWQHRDEIDDYRLTPRDRSYPGIQPVPDIPWDLRSPGPAPFPPLPRNPAPGPAPSLPPTVPKYDYYKPLPPNSPNPWPPLNNTAPPFNLNPTPAPTHNSPSAPDEDIPRSEYLPPFDRRALVAQNLTAHVLRMKGAPEADIGAAINDPALMKDLLNQLYGGHSTIAPGGDSDGPTSQAGRGRFADRPDQVSTPTGVAPSTYLPFGRTGLTALLR